MNPNLENMLAILKPEIKIITLSEIMILENIESLLDRLGPQKIQIGANQFIDEHNIDRLRELSGELKQAAEIIYEVVRHFENASAENSRELACK